MQRKKEKKLDPSLRENRRYLVVESNKEEVEKAILDYLGILGWGKAAPVWVGDILSVSREEVDRIRAALEIAGLKIKKISGTLKSLE